MANEQKTEWPNALPDDDDLTHYMKAVSRKQATIVALEAKLRVAREALEAIADADPPLGSCDCSDCMEPYSKAREALRQLDESEA